ncbi:MAG: hypothetical protein ABFD54_05880 [Armatimonadota bacterium]|nr:hypothetical protein [bacterium]
MRKQTTIEDRRLIRKVNTRLVKGMTWPQIAIDLGYGNNWKQLYNRLYAKTIQMPDKTLRPIDQAA